MPVLSKTTVVSVARFLEAAAVAHQQPAARTEGRRDRDDERDGEAERVRAGNHEHGDHALDRERRVACPSDQPRDERDRTPATIATNVSRNAARSASACARERELCACSTSRMMPASAVARRCP